VKSAFHDTNVVCAAAGVYSSRVASLLLVVLIDKLDYVTEWVILCSIVLTMLMMMILMMS